MENNLDSLFKKPTDTGMDSLFKKPSNPKMDTLFKAPVPKPNIADPRNGLSKSQIAEAEANKKSYHKTDDALATVLPISGSDAVAFGKGFTHNMDEYGASINKGLDKISKTILPKEYQTTFFEDNAKYWDDNRKMNEIETEDNSVAHLAGELINDPINLAPVGLFSKGKKLARVGKSMVAGAGVGAGIGVAKSYGNDSLTSSQKQDHIAMGAGVVSILNGVIAGLTKGKVSNAIKDVDQLTGSAREEADHAIDAMLNNPEAFGLTTEKATKLSSEYQALLKENTGRSSRLPVKDEVATGAGEIVPNFVTHGKPEDVATGGLDQKGSFMLNRLLKNVEGRKSDLPEPTAKSYKQEDGTFNWEAYGSEHPESKIFDANGNELNMPTPRPELIREKSNANFNESDNLDDILGFSPEEVARIEENLKTKSDLSTDADTFITQMDKGLSKSRSPITLEFRKLIQDNPLAQRAIDSARNRYAKSTYSPTSGGSSSSWIDPNTGLVTRAGNKGGKNADFDFALTKSDINKISKGEVTEDILMKLKTDMSRFESDPMFAEVGTGKFRPEQYNIAHENLSTSEKTVRGEQQSLGFEGTQNPLFDTGAETQLQVPSWAKDIVSDTVRYEDIVKAVTEAKNGNRTPLADRALEAMSKDAKLSEKLNPTQDPNTLFANVGHNLAGGFGAGTVNAGSGMFDEGDTADKMADRFIQGLVAGVAGVNGLKVLRKTNPKAFEKVRSWVMDNNVKVGDKLPTDGVQLGVFAGKKAKGFEGKKTHTGKYDGQTRFEIDDSAMEVLNKGVVELSSKGYTNLDKIIKHDELFNNYPQLRNVMVKFDKNMESHATFDGEGTITLSNKFKNKDEMSSSIIHEIQHWVQNKEGFAGGGNFDDMMMQVEGKIYNLEKKGELSELDAMNYKNDLDYLKNNRSAEAFDKYKKIAGEIEAREVQARKNLTPEERELIPNYENADTMVTGHSDEAYNSAFMAKLDGRHGDFESTGIHADDATLDFSRNKSDYTAPQSQKQGGLFGNHFDDLEQKATENANKDWKDISQDNGKLTNMKNSIKHLFMDSFSGKYHKSRDLTHANLEASNVEIGRVAHVLDTLDDNLDKELYQYLSKTGGENLPQKVKDVGDMIRAKIDSLGEELVQMGVLNKKDVDEWIGAYLFRQYQPRVDKKVGGFFNGNFKMDSIGERGDPKTFKKNDVKNMVGWLNKNGFIEDADMINFTSTKQVIDHLENSGFTGKLSEGGLQVRDLGDTIKIKRDWTKSERESMGEIESAKFSVPETLARLNRLKQHGMFLQRAETLRGVVADKKMVESLSNQELKKAGFRQLDSTPAYGALSGKWVRADVADDVTGSTADILQTHSELFKTWNGYNSLWKKSKTVWNPTAHVNNFTGNLFLMHMAGVNGSKLAGVLKEGGKAMSALKQIEKMEVEHLTTGATTNSINKLKQLKIEAKFALEAKEMGIFGKSQLNDILAGIEKTTVRTGLLAKADELASKAYQFEDNFNRLSFFLTLRQSGRNKETAKHMVDYMLPDYSKPLPKGWKTLRDTSIAPFISWSYYTMPSIVRMLGEKRGAVKVATVMASISALEYQLTGGAVTPRDNLPFIKGNKPEDFKGRRFGIGRDGDNINTIKMDRMIPYMELKNPINYAKSQFSGVLPNLFSTINGNQMYNGRPITYKNKSGVDKGLDWMKHLAKQYAPIPMPVMNAVDLADSAIRSKKKRKRNDTIQPRTPTQEILKNVGINTMSYSKRGLKRDQKKN